MSEAGKVLTLTEAAAGRVKHVLAKSGNPDAVLRLGITSHGCSGLSYAIELAGEKDPEDTVVEDKGATVYIQRKATAYLLGSEMDYVEGKLESGFVFTNPNEKGRCGCGISFRV